MLVVNVSGNWIRSYLYVSCATYPIDMSVKRNIMFTSHIEMTGYEIELTFPAVFEVTRTGNFKQEVVTSPAMFVATRAGISNLNMMFRSFVKYVFLGLSPTRAQAQHCHRIKLNIITKTHKGAQSFSISWICRKAHCQHIVRRLACYSTTLDCIYFAFANATITSKDMTHY